MRDTVRTDFDSAAWLTSSFCDLDGCVQVAKLADGQVAVRDTKNESQSPLVFTADEWSAFVAGVRAGEFD